MQNNNNNNNKKKKKNKNKKKTTTTKKNKKTKKTTKNKQTKKQQQQQKKNLNTSLSMFWRSATDVHVVYSVRQNLIKLFAIEDYDENSRFIWTKSLSILLNISYGC